MSSNRKDLSNCKNIGEREEEFEGGEEKKQLEGLFVSDNESLHDSLLMKMLHKCNSLNYFVVMGCTKLTDASLSKVSQMCPHLNLFDFSNCHLATDKSLASLCEAKALEILKLRNVAGISTDGVNVVLKSCTRLTTLVLSNCWPVNDNIGPALKSHPSLTSCSLSGTLCTIKQARIWSSEFLKINLKGLK